MTTLSLKKPRAAVPPTPEKPPKIPPPIQRFIDAGTVVDIILRPAGCSVTGVITYYGGGFIELKAPTFWYPNDGRSEASSALIALYNITSISDLFGHQRGWQVEGGK